MDCIYLNRMNEERHCHAHPVREREIVTWYTPNEEDLKQFCAAKFGDCPRLNMFHEYLKATHK